MLFRVNWVQPTMKSFSSVRRVRLRSFQTRSVPPLCFAMRGGVCVRKPMCFPLYTTDCGGKIVLLTGYKAQVINTSLTNRMAWPWTSKVSKEVGKEKKINGQMPQSQQRKNVPSTAPGKLERKRKLWSKSGTGTNYPRHKRSDSKAVALRGRTQQRKLSSHYKVSSSARLYRAARARQVRMSTYAS